MKKQKEKPSVSPTLKIALAVAAVVVVGILVLIMGRVQQSDPTLTQAPPPGPQAQTLARSLAKSKHPGPMYVMTPSGPILNQSGALPPQAGDAQPAVAPASLGTPP